MANIHRRGAIQRRRQWEPVGYWDCPEAHGLAYGKLDAELDPLVHNWMRRSRLLAHPDYVPKSADLGLWKLLNEYTKGEGKTLVRLYRCPAWEEAHCHAGIRILEGHGWICANGYLRVSQQVKP